ncbi:MAG: chorismate mutase [Planctomycetota bacterium]
MADDAELVAMRAQIDATNLELCEVLQRRARLVMRIARRKRALGLPLVDAARESAMLEAAMVEPGDGFAPDELAAALAQVFAHYRRLCLRVGSEP